MLMFLVDAGNGRVVFNLVNFINVAICFEISIEVQSVWIDYIYFSSRCGQLLIPEGRDFLVFPNSLQQCRLSQRNFLPSSKHLVRKLLFTSSLLNYQVISLAQAGHSITLDLLSTKGHATVRRNFLSNFCCSSSHSKLCPYFKDTLLQSFINT